MTATRPPRTRSPGRPSEGNAGRAHSGWSGTTWHDMAAHPGLGLELGDQASEAELAAATIKFAGPRSGWEPGKGRAGGLTHRLRPRRSAADPPAPQQTAPHPPRP